MSTCIIVTGGEPPHPGVAAHLPTGADVIAADSGLDHADDLGLAVRLVVGDLDSVSKDALERARDAGVAVQEHASEKDETDLELAMAAAVARGADRLVIVSGGGGRLDPLLAGVAALAEPGLHHALDVSAWLGAASVDVLHAPG